MMPSACTYTDAEVKKIEARLGRRMTDRERLFGELVHRVDHRTSEQRIVDSKWEVKMAPLPNPTIYDDAIAAAEAENARNAEMRAYVKMSESERRLHNLKRDRDKELGDRATAQAESEQQKAVAGKVQTLKELAERIHWDLNWHAQEAETVRRAIESFEMQGADLEEANNLYAAAFKIERAKKAEYKAAVEARMEQLGSQRDELEAEITALDSRTKSKPTRREVDNLWNAYEAVADQDSPEGVEARANWLDAVNAFGGLDAVNAESAKGGDA